MPSFIHKMQASKKRPVFSPTVERFLVHFKA